ncbi:MAG: VWA domain-containing protein [Acidobacteriota bacterium]|nr:VWA domain-containing protein [Acidobacteriota bacterium]
MSARRRRTRPRRALLWALAMLAVATSAQAQRQRTISAEVRGRDGGAVVIAPTDLRVFEGQSRREVLRTETLEAGDWSVLVYLDAVAMGEDEQRDVADMLAEAAEELLRLGPVTLIAADTLVEPWLEGEDSVAAVRDALREAAVTSFDRPIGRPRAELASQRRALFIDTLVRYGDREGGPKVALVLGDVNGERDVGDDDAQAERGLLAASAATLDWVVHPLHPAGAGGEVPVSPLAEETGGRLVADAAGLTAALEGLVGRLRVDYISSRRDEGTDGLSPLTVAARDESWTVRSARWAALTTPNFVVTSRARYLVAEGEEGDLDVAASVAVESDGAGREEVTFEVLTDLASLARAGRTTADLRVSLVVDRLDEELVILHNRGKGRELDEASRWLLQLRTPSPGEVMGVVALVEDMASGLWGATTVSFDSDDLGVLGAETIVERLDLTPALADPVAESPEDQLIRVLPPRERSLTGEQVFRTMILNSLIQRVVFLLDGDEVAEDARAPFSARIDLGALAPHELSAIAYDRAGRELSRDSVIVNRERQAFEVEIVRVDGEVAAGEITVRAQVTTPINEVLQRVEVWWNDELRSSSTDPSVVSRLEVKAGPGGADFVRVVATLGDGTTAEDVELFGVPGIVEEVDVNLVEVFAVAIDESGAPVRDLEVSDFRVTLKGKQVELERFGLAQDVPLALGLVIDTSQSMDILIDDARIAAIKFLSDAKRGSDHAFLVDFDSQPRLAQGLTRDLGALINALGSLVAGGNTALYDSILFSLLHFEGTEDRRALVLLTDGDDYRSRFSERRASLQARSLGVPVYMISLAGLEFLRPSLRKTDLEYIARMTGGEVFYVSSREELSPTYDRIVNELRSQYVMAFSLARELTEREIEKIEVKVRRPGLRVRAVVAGRSVQ